MSPSALRRYLRFWGSNIREDVDDELRFHIDMRVKEYMARGMSEIDARRLAAERFGNVDRARTECVVINESFSRSQGRAQFMQGLKQDLVFATRLLRRQRLPSVVATLCLALGIGATTTMFSIGSTLLLRPLPFPNGDRVVSVLAVRLTGDPTKPARVISYPDFVDWRTRAHSFDEMAAIGTTSFTVLLPTAPSRANGGVVSPGFFKVLGVQAEAGRLLTDDDERPEAPRVVVVSHTFAERQLGGAATVVGKEFLIAGEKRTVVGIVPDLGRLPSQGQMWAPLARNYNKESRGNRNLEVFAVLKRGMTIDAASREMDRLGRQIAQEHPDQDAYIGSILQPLRERFVGASRAGLAALSVATLLVLLIACTNVAALQIARSTARAREIAVRTAIGASKSRVVRQLLTESVIIAIAGATLGVLVALGGMKYVVRGIASQVPPWMQFRLDLLALGFTLVVSIVVGIAFGILPALRLSRVDPSDVLRGGRAAVGISRAFLQRAFVVAEIALSVLLVIGASLAIQSVSKLRSIPVGLDPSNVVTFRLSLQGPRHDDPAERGRVIEAFRNRIAALPGVEGVGATTYVPINGCCSQFGTQIAGRETDSKHMLMVTGNMVTPDFFKALRIPLLAGRDFTPADNAAAPKVVIINETFAKQYWPTGDAIGHQIDTGNGMSMIIGIVGDIKQSRLIDPPEPQFYRPHLQDPWTAMVYTVRVKGTEPTRIMPEVRKAFKAIDPMLPVYGVGTLEQAIAETVDSAWLFGMLFTAFAIVALTLATAGVYATMSFFVSQRTRELGLRVALGARPAAVVGFVMRHAAVLAILGGVLGIGGGIFGARALAHLLYGVSASEPLVYAVGATVLMTAAVLAAYGPARRASAVDPMIALRAE